MIVNVQGDEPFIEPNVINSVAALLHRRADASAMRKLHNAEEFGDSAVVKVITDRAGCAFISAAIPAAKDSDIAPSLDIARAHIGIYAYRADFLQQLSQLSPSPMEQSESLEQLRILWHGVIFIGLRAVLASPRWRRKSFRIAVIFHNRKNINAVKGR